jgi:hypothetical protein
LLVSLSMRISAYPRFSKILALAEIQPI